MQRVDFSAALRDLFHYFHSAVIKEWSILAIRNLLEDNLENQKLIHQLTAQGRLTSEAVKEFQPENGFMRLQ